MTTPNPFYSVPGLNVETYDVRTAEDASVLEGDIDFYAEMAARFRGPVLELGSGTGRVSWALAGRGFEVTGLDASPRMIERAEAKRSGFPGTVGDRMRFVRGDMAAFDLGLRFGTGIVPFRGFQCLLAPEDQAACLDAVHRHLVPGGGLVLDLFDPWLDMCVPGKTLPRTVARVLHPERGNPVTVERVSRDVDPLGQVLRETWRFRETGPGGEVLEEEDEVLSMRWTYRWEARYLFEAHGFEVVEEFSDYRGSPPSYGREQVWVLRRV